ncbi:hypothetical protein [Pseudomonas tohonis]|uniref:hypothetical protein n=1 Tax=Pseudomonas tohonis TaxID=2725477 RepID=UPI001F3D1268|nr:hypothetical protein [Pseudomonas tohonis]
MKNKRLLIYAAIFMTAYGIAHIFSIRIQSEDFSAVLDRLFDVSSMVFTLMGIWVAFLYPNALLRLTNPNKIETADFSETLGETKRLEAIVAAILKSAAVVCVILLVELSQLTLHATSLYKEHSRPFNLTAFSVAITLSAIQLEAVMYVIFSNVMFINDLHSKRENREGDEDI